MIEGLNAEMRERKRNVVEVPGNKMIETRIGSVTIVNGVLVVVADGKLDLREMKKEAGDRKLQIVISILQIDKNLQKELVDVMNPAVGEGTKVSHVKNQMLGEVEIKVVLESRSLNSVSVVP